MSEIGSLPEGYAHCGCHPETCSHFDGMVYVGIEGKFVIDDKQMQKVLADKMFVGADVARNILSNYGIESFVKGDPHKYDKEVGLFKNLNDNLYSGDIGIPNIRYETYSSRNFTCYHRRYSIIGVFDYILKHQSKERKLKWEQFQASL